MFNYLFSLPFPLCLCASVPLCHLALARSLGVLGDLCERLFLYAGYALIDADVDGLVQSHVSLVIVSPKVPFHQLETRRKINASSTVVAPVVSSV